MKEIYHAANQEVAEMALGNFEKKWNNKCAYAVSLCFTCNHLAEPVNLYVCIIVFLQSFVFCFIWCNVILEI